MITEFRLEGLSAGNRCTLAVDHTDRNWFHAPTRLQPDRFQALFDYFKKADNAWSGKNIAVVEHDGLLDDGTPENPVVIEFKLDV